MAAKKRARRSRTSRPTSAGLSPSIKREVEKARFAGFEEYVVRHLVNQGDVVTTADGWDFVRSHPRHVMAWFRKHLAPRWERATDAEIRREAADAARSMRRWL
jgi:hypothetical protein